MGSDRLERARAAFRVANRQAPGENFSAQLKWQRVFMREMERTAAGGYRNQAIWDRNRQIVDFTDAQILRTAAMPYLDPGRTRTEWRR